MIQPVRGTHDLIGEEARRHLYVVETAKKIVSLYGFEEWMTPIFENTNVFLRSLGETSDVVSKEMYCFQDRGGESLTLRPEGTAGICRALLTNGLSQSLPQKVFYYGPMFRYERPQKGRYRQFHQIGAELIGAPFPFVDAEIIAMGYHILTSLGVHQEIVLELNTLGDAGSRKNWREALIQYFQSVKSELSDDSLARLDKNPLRILDSKDPKDRALLEHAPRMHNYLSKESIEFWDKLRTALDHFKVPFNENPYIVRGLDYYSHTVFEFVTQRLGAQGTVLAGGRYEELVSQMGGGSIPCIGWGAGVERLSSLLETIPPKPISILVIPFSERNRVTAFTLLQELRYHNIKAEISYKTNVRKQLEYANKIHASMALLIGDDEETENKVQVKDLLSGEQSQIPLSQVVSYLQKKVMS